MSNGDGNTSDPLDTAVGSLRTHASQGEQNPHKLLLLITLAELIKTKPDHPNRFTFEELEPVFLAKFASCLPNRPPDRRHLEYPFYHLQRDGFWHLKLRPGKETIFRQYERTRLTRLRLIETVEFAYLDGDVLSALRVQNAPSILESRLKTLAPASAEVGRGDSSRFEHEQWAIDIIRRDVAQSGLGSVLNNVQFFDNQSNLYYEYDVIVMAHSGIYVVELKHWAGHIRVARDYWTRDGDRHPPDPHRNNRYKCQVLKGLYERQFPYYPSLWVTSVVVLTNPEATVENADSPAEAAAGRRDYLTFKSVEDLLTFLRLRDQGQQGTLLKDAVVNDVHKFLAGRVNPTPSIRYTVPGYETVEYLSQRPECIELVARRTDGRSRGLYRFRVFRIPVGASAEERERARRKAFNTVDAVKRIGEHRNVLRVSVWQNDEGDILEQSDWSEAGTLRQILTGRREPMPLDQALAICHGIGSALAEAHQLGIVHRAVRPEHILIANDVPKLLDFDLSFDLERPAGEVTVIPDPAALKDDGYTAPELLQGKRFSEYTDLFSLGVLAYELLTGHKPFATAGRLAALGGRLGKEQLEQLRQRGVPETVVAAISGVLVTDPDARQGDAEAMAAAFEASAEPARPPNAPLEPGSRYDLYQIVKLIGQGADGQVYLASAEEQEPVALKLFDQEVPRERIFGQVRSGASVTSRHLVRHASRPGQWQNDRFFAVMEYIDGGTLRDRIERGDRPDPGAFQSMALGLLQALKAMHGRCDEAGQAIPLIHGDVKPENVLLTSGGEPKLTDFSIAGPPRTGRFQGTPGYVPPDRIQESDMEFAQDGDLFGLGVTLWEYAFGARPFEFPVAGAQAVLPAGAEDRFSPEICNWLLRSVGTTAAHRFATAAEMEASFKEALSPRPVPAVIPLPCVQVTPPGITIPGEAAPPAHPEPAIAVEYIFLAQTAAISPAAAAAYENPFVAYLNTLSNTSPGNTGATAEGQEGSQYFARIRVDNPIAAIVRRWLTDESRNVILTGNAGDGKTTVAAEVYRSLCGGHLPAAPRTTVPGHPIVIVKDMSELTDQQRASYLEEAAGSRELRYLVVSNTGTLLKAVSGSGLATADPNGKESELLSALEAEGARDILSGRLRLLNVGRTDSIDTACRVLGRMLESENWRRCEGCGLARTCPIVENVALVQGDAETVLRRVELVYRRLYEYGIRLTMRQMTGHLAYALTSGRNCARVHGMSVIALDERGARNLFFNRFFGDDGRLPAPEAGQMEPVRQLRLADLGVALDPGFERDAWSGQAARLPLTGQPLEVFLRIRGTDDVASAEARKQTRRLVYFFGQFSSRGERTESRYVTGFLRSPMLLDYLKVARGDGSVPAAWEADWRRRVVQVVQEYFAGVRLPQGLWRDPDPLYVTLNRRAAGSGTQLVLARVPTTDFHFATRRAHADIDLGGWRLGLALRGKAVELPLELPFLDFVAGRYEGEVAAQLDTFYADRVERFQAQLLAASPDADAGGSTLRLLRLGPERKLEPTALRLADGRMEVL